MNYQMTENKFQISTKNKIQILKQIKFEDFEF